jgi:septation ring formation regulator EzrA
MADPTLADVMAAIANLATAVHRVDLQNQQQTALLAALTTGVQLMSDQVESEVAAEHVLAGKVDLLLAAFADAKTANGTLQASIAALTAQIQQLQADGVITAADADKLTAATAEMAAKSAAIDTALTPPAPTP